MAGRTTLVTMPDAIPENDILLVDAFVVQVGIDVLSVSEAATGGTSVVRPIGVIAKRPHVGADAQRSVRESARS